jgi:ribosomal protein S18 acetylase RimI-like enzyme
VEIRPVRPEEFEPLGRLTVLAYTRLPGHVQEPDDEALTDVASRAVRALVLAAVEAGDVLGGVTYVDDPGSPLAEHDDPDAAAIRMLAVAPEAQGRGVGRALTESCLTRAREAGRRRVVLHSTPWMTTAHRLYESLGFRRAPDLDWTPVPDIPLLGFRLDLAPASVA